MQQKPEILHRYWFAFEQVQPLIAPIFCGVTAYDYDDSLAIMRNEWFSHRKIPRIIDVRTDVDMDTLYEEFKYLLPPAHCPAWRGVWYPAFGVTGPVIGSVTNDW